MGARSDEGQEGRHRLVIAGKDKGAKGKVIAGLPRAADGSWSRASTGSRSTPGSARPARRQDRRHRHPGGADPRHQRDGGRLRRQADPRRLPKVDEDDAQASGSRGAPVRTSDDDHDDRPSGPCRGSSSATATRSRAQLREQFGYANVMQVPGVVKIVVNMGVGEAARDAKLIDGAVRDLTTITGQKPQVRRAASPSRSSSCARACRSARR